jgi:rRNA maturation endonuclease Nob1
MIIGTDNYLTETIFEEFSDAIVDKFSHVANVISSWHSEGIEAKESESIEVVRQDSTFTTIQEQKTMQSTRSIGIRNDLKYCMDCGEQLPLKAKFCFKCGVEQSA